MAALQQGEAVRLAAGREGKRQKHPAQPHLTRPRAACVPGEPWKERMFLPFSILKLLIS